MYLSVAIDEPADIGAIKQLSAVIKYVNTEYTPVTSYLSLVGLPESPKIVRRFREVCGGWYRSGERNAGAPCWGNRATSRPASETLPPLNTLRCPQIGTWLTVSHTG